MTFKFENFTGVAAPLLDPNINTDIILPARYLRRLTAEGLGDVLFREWRFDETGAKRPGFVLNQPAYTHASILLTGDNFGCGSSRENAVWALYDYGIRCIVGTSFGDIFYNNCLNYGLLPVRLAANQIEILAKTVTLRPDTPIHVDLESCEVRWPDHVAHFSVAEHSRRRLALGLDEISLTLVQHETDIQNYESERKHQLPWLFKDIEESHPSQ